MEWNQLPADCVHDSNVNKTMFNNRIDKYLVKAGYIKKNKGRLHLE